jgi:SAM-dependent methyltransferase
MDSLFNNVDVTGKKVLDVGGGSGFISFYAACKRAGKVVCLEPQTDGSATNVTDNFMVLKKILKLDTVELHPVTFQEFKSQELFDVVIFHNSINHLDEDACISLLGKRHSKSVYNQIFSKVNDLSEHGAKLIIADSSRFNIFQLIGLRNPFVPSIEWEKHQTPQVWSKLLRKAGFVNHNIRWSTFNRCGNWGKIIFNNPWISYLLTSHFCLTAEKP